MKVMFNHIKQPNCEYDNCSLEVELSDSDIVAIVERYNELYTEYQVWLLLEEAKALENGGYNLPSFSTWVTDWYKGD